MNMEKQSKIDQIYKLINELNEMVGESGVFFINSDQSEMKVDICLKGNMPTLSMGLCNKLQNNEEFRRIMLSMVGSFLVNNKNHQEEFIRLISSNVGSVNLN